MFAHVLTLGGDFQVLGPVIKLVAVAVVDSLGRRQRAPEHLLSDKSMLENVSTADANDAIAVVVDASSTPPVAGGFARGPVGTGPRTEATRHATAKLPLLQGELSPTPGALEYTTRPALSLHRSPVYHFDEEEQAIRRMFEAVL